MSNEQIKIGIIGTGYVGLVQGVILATFGHDVLCMDVSEEKIMKLRQGILPIYEPGLEKLLTDNITSGNLSFTVDCRELVEESDVIFIAVGTPEQEDGSADLTHVISVANDIGAYINRDKVVVNKSTVPVGTGKVVQGVIERSILERGLTFEVDVVSNPEFLREGKAVEDCLKPDRVVIGVQSEKAKQIMLDVYQEYTKQQIPFIISNVETAEMIKYASNAFLAVKISFINEMALLAEKVGANIEIIANAMGLDSRISPQFLKAGPGYGGSCFPKDTKAVCKIASEMNLQLLVIEAAIKANEKQKIYMVDKICKKVTNTNRLDGKVIAILGLSFKPDTDDMREAPSLDIIRGLIERGAKIQAYCPKGMKEAKWRLADIEQEILYTKNEYEAAKDANALVIITDWKQFYNMDLEKIRSQMKENYLFDLRNMFSEKRELVSEFKYYGLGIEEV